MRLAGDQSSGCPQLFQTLAPAAPSSPAMKRGRDELEGDGSEEGRGEQAAPAAAAAADGSGSEQERQQQQPDEGQQPAAQQAEEDDEDDKPLVQNYRMSKTLRKGAECPYLDTISRQVWGGGAGGRLCYGGCCTAWGAGNCTAT